MTQFQKGKMYTCVVSKSPAYKVGRDYKVYVNSKGQLCMRGEDGIEDLVIMLQSDFKEARD